MKVASKEPKFQLSKRTYMSDEAFAELKAATEDALAFQQGNRRAPHHPNAETEVSQNRLDPEDIQYN